MGAGVPGSKADFVPPPRPADPVGQIIQRSKEWERVKPHPSPLCAAYRRKTRFRTSCSGTDTELMRVRTEIRCLLAPPHESVYYLTGYMRWCGGAGSRLGEDAEVDRLAKKVDKASYCPPIAIQAKKVGICELQVGREKLQFSSHRSGNRRMAEKRRLRFGKR